MEHIGKILLNLWSRFHWIFRSWGKMTRTFFRASPDADEISDDEDQSGEWIHQQYGDGV